MAIFGIYVKLPECNPTWRTILGVAALPVESPGFTEVLGCRENGGQVGIKSIPEDPCYGIYLVGVYGKCRYINSIAVSGSLNIGGR